MSWENDDDIRAQLVGAGLIIDKTLRLDAKIQRWKVDGEDQERRGWSRLREWTSPNSGKTYIVGSFGVWHGNDDGYTRIELGGDRAALLTDEEKRALRAAHLEETRRLAQIRKTEVNRAARWAEVVWNKCQLATEHDYLTRKQIGAHGLRIMPDSTDGMRLDGLDDSNFYRLKMAAGALVIPMHDTKGSIMGLQFVYAKGHPRRAKIGRDKEFWPSGMAMGGTFGLIGHLPRSGVLLIAEGYATAASLHESTGYPAAYAFSANNLARAAKEISKTCPALRLLFCADDDYLTDGNPGCTEAAKASAGLEQSSWIKPAFPVDAEGTDLRSGKKLTDFNDLLVMSGLPITLADQINAALDELKWRDAKPRAVQTMQGGGAREALKSMLTLDEAVERFALVFGSKGTMFDYQEHILVPKQDVLDIIPEHGWRDMRAIKRVARMDEVGFDPPGTDARITCNLWGGWPTVPKQGSCECLLSLLEYLCNEEEDHLAVFIWVMRWLAYPIQHPGAKMRTALIFHGPQGTGKNLFFEAVMAIYGEYGRIIDQSAIEDKFNDWASKKLFMIADEIVARNELFHLKNKLKGLVTGEWIRINPKNVSAHDERNHVNLVFLSNEDQPLHLDKDDRRFGVIHTPQKLDADFYQQVRDELNNGGIAALHWHLLNLDLGDFDEHSKPPVTRAKRDLIDISRDSVQMFIDEWVSGRLDLPVGPAGSAELYEAYCWFCRVNGENRPRAARQFIGSVKHLHGWEYGEENRMEGSRRVVRGTVTPPVVILDKHNSRKPDELNKAAWLTLHCEKFKNALESVK